MMIRWNDPRDGGKRNQSFLLSTQPFLNNYHGIFVPSADGPDESIGLLSIIVEAGPGVQSTITSTKGVSSEI